jgi:hypothetical protein
LSHKIFALENPNIDEKKRNYKLTFGQLIKLHPLLIKHQVLSFCGSLGKGSLIDTKKMFDNLKKLFISKINQVFLLDCLLSELNDSVFIGSSIVYDATNLLSDVEIQINHLVQTITEYSMWEDNLSKSKGTKRQSAATIFEAYKQNKKQKKDASVQTGFVKKPSNKPSKKTSKSKVSHSGTKSLEGLNFLSSDIMPSDYNSKAFSPISELEIIEEFKTKFYDSSSDQLLLQSPYYITVLDVHEEEKVSYEMISRGF